MDDGYDAEIGHYLVAVAGQLLDDGLPVTAVHACGIADVAGEGVVEFSRAFRGGEAGLHWSAASGWRFRRVPGGAARWMGGGLVPPVDRVAAFMAAVLLDPAGAGSGEQPYFDAERDGLVERLRKHVPGGSVAAALDYEYRFHVVRSEAYRDRAVASLLQGGPQVVEVALRQGELRALVQLLEYADGAAAPTGAGALARRLAADLTGRAPAGRAGLDRHREALSYAVGHRDAQVGGAGSASGGSG
ncbi:hypothetical protein [Streptomyces sp. NBC_00503]|uniref:hypothetical protein n=1 Tax=Streptomyces sp. NBC_00503 TaxID=2903659 RepID=UPI002E811CEE|nr:hypothetical protein [Streptomyces sp. NBC_00503]WUD86370.1 DUF6292 family protein [Streptomyces sp. NBC_00503]